ncbi:hypothetical protein APHAL10511_003017 [Amanita phalloides]|nr:hypothetical protein APHAL10511_003017 [Amanita phalloides]
MNPRTSNLGQTKSPLANIPFELQEHIIIEFIRDPYTTFDQLKSLRLVSRSFNDVVAPKVLSCIRLFRHGDSALPSMRQLQALTSSNSNNHLYMTDTLLLGNWKWIYGDKLFVSFREMRNTGLWVPGIIVNSTLLPFIYFLGFLFMPHLLPLTVFNSAVRLRARHRLSHTSSLNMPNIRRVEWTAERDDPNWITSRTVKLLAEFSQLTDLVLIIDEEQDLSYIAKHLSKLRNLRKFMVDIRYWPGKLIRSRSSQINDFGKVIGANPHLTHLELLQGYGGCGDLSKIFSYVPAERPLILEHLGISDNFSEPAAVVPHIQSLKSLDLTSYWSSRFLLVLLTRRIFPPVVKTARVDDNFLDFLSSHPRIVSLSIHSTYEEFVGKAILEIMARHSSSLTCFSTSSLSFCRCLYKIQNEFSLLKCMRLEKLVLWFDYYVGTDVDVQLELAMALSVIARLQKSLTLVVTDILAFKACIRHCGRSRNPLIRDLTGRIVYEKDGIR